MALPTMHVQNELSGNLRLRNRKSLDDSTNASLNESGYATSLNNTSPESTPLRSTRDTRERNNSGCPVQRKWPETPPPVELQQRWGATTKWGTVVRTETFKDLLPVAVAFVVMTSCIVVVCTLTFGLDRDPMSSTLPENLNGKYRSIAFANSKRQERFKRDYSRIQSGELKDEDGVLLGGKRASIQFAHNLKNKVDSEEISDVTTSPEIDATEAVKHDKLTFRMPSNIIRDLKEANPNKQTKKGNSNAPERDLEPEQPAVRGKRDTTKSGEDQLKSAKRNPAKQPFRFAKRESVKDNSDVRTAKHGSTEKKSFRKFEQTS